MLLSTHKTQGCDLNVPVKGSEDHDFSDTLQHQIFTLCFLVFFYLFTGEQVFGFLERMFSFSLRHLTMGWVEFPRFL